MFSKQINVNFLPVGLTHADVDQLISKISMRLRHNGSESLQGMQCNILIDGITYCIIQLILFKL